jgi:hypothetical protein
MSPRDKYKSPARKKTMDGTTIVLATPIAQKACSLTSGTKYSPLNPKTLAIIINELPIMRLRSLFKKTKTEPTTDRKVNRPYVIDEWSIVAALSPINRLMNPKRPMVNASVSIIRLT